MFSSLRSRLGLLVGVGTLALVAAAALAIAYERWQEENETLSAAVELATFQLGDTVNRADAAAVAVPEVGGRDRFVLVLDDEGEVIVGRGALGETLLDEILEDIFAVTVDDEVVARADYTDDRGDIHVAGVSCVVDSVCDTVVVGAGREGFGTYALARWWWLLAPPVAAGLAAFAAARWLVGRSLRPVEAMRRELETITSTDLDRRVPVPATGDELQQLGTTMNDTIGRLGTTVAANERFVADAAHELRSPITGVRAALEIEAGRTGSGLLGDAVVELDRAGRLVDDLLVLARRRGGAPEPRRDVDLDDVVGQVVSMARGRYPEITIEQRLAPARISAVPDAVTRIVTNLVDNACRYGRGRVAVALAADEGRCRLTVDDDGDGVPAAERDRIFERFARTDGSRARSSGGSGLGLAIVAELLEDHDGRVTVTDGPLGGARFEVELPSTG